MNDATTAFFSSIGSRGHEPLLQKAKGTVRFDVVEGGKTSRWLLAVDKGRLTLTRKNAAADCVVRSDKALFDQIVTGEQSAVAAVLRGELAIEGDWRLLVLVQRLFPGPPRKKKRRPAGYARRRS
jgi:putative sterol carrier protein